MYPVWLMTMTAPPVRGTCSTPVIMNRRPCAANTTRAIPMTPEYTGSMALTYGTVAQSATREASGVRVVTEASVSAV
jgi:hypothetical protein